MVSLDALASILISFSKIMASITYLCKGHQKPATKKHRKQQNASDNYGKRQKATAKQQKISESKRKQQKTIESRNILHNKRLHKTAQDAAESSRYQYKATRSSRKQERAADGNRNQ